MATKLQERKIDIEFDVLDENRNGVLEQSDYARMAKKFLEEFNVSQRSRRGKVVIAAYDALWERHRSECDIDDDGHITKAEYREIVSKDILRENGFNEVHIPLIRSIFRLVDCAEKGVLNRDEFARVMSVYGVPERDSMINFTDLDVDNNNRLSQDEIIRAFREFYLSTNPLEPANRLFGWAY